jgi:hypothetical protein
MDDGRVQKQLSVAYKMEEDILMAQESGGKLKPEQEDFPCHEVKKKRNDDNDEASLRIMAYVKKV